MAAKACPQKTCLAHTQWVPEENVAYGDDDIAKRQWQTGFEAPHESCPGCGQHDEQKLLGRYSGGVGSHWEHEYHCLACHTTWEEMYQYDSKTFGCHGVIDNVHYGAKAKGKGLGRIINEECYDYAEA